MKFVGNILTETFPACRLMLATMLPGRYTCGNACPQELLSGKRHRGVAKIDEEESCGLVREDMNLAMYLLAGDTKGKRNVNLHARGT